MQVSEPHQTLNSSNKVVKNLEKLNVPPDYVEINKYALQIQTSAKTKIIQEVKRAPDNQKLIERNMTFSASYLFMG